MVKKIASKSSGNAITNFIRSEITAPEKRAGNTSIAISLTVFGLAVTFLRSLGDIGISAKLDTPRTFLKPLSRIRRPGLDTSRSLPPFR
ncbi:hypothetical protein BGZ95_002252 [Linnemannia exigua]|uniref:Uncharacterized protein n=1 Tax=Linnemannia exigua TaxID=604196 RepID=A0AAD4H364_9FUNG|nr:hypothetical protein BGZ95_002252 [Linnemannia exigua]